MNAVDVIAKAARSTGYRDEAIVRDYAFADVLDPSDTTREVALAAFTQTPPSYRSAALAVVPAGQGATQELVRAHRALGAPLLFVIEGDHLSLWQVRRDTPRRLHESMSVGDVPALFEQHRDSWRPDAIHRAKSIGAIDQSYQLDFVDLGLLPAVEGEIHTKLDRLLVDTLAASSDAQHDSPPDTRLLFRVVFRLLAAKVLQDRRHPDAELWNANELAAILGAIETYYSLPPVDVGYRQNMPPAFLAAWECLRGGISFANISSDDLAFVYENTLVTPEARRHFGTHSTPRQLAEYAVTRLGLHRYPPEELSVYEPFAGASVFLISALRHMRDLLPVSWRDKQRHDFLIEHLAGDEIDPFACEVATLSLILADYPNRDGWRITESDLFDDRNLKARLNDCNIVLCNPPFQDFTADERSHYPISSEVYSKPVAVLNAVLEAHPLAFALVLPHVFILDRKFSEQRKEVEKLYTNVELVALPEGIFRASGIESVLVIAQQPRSSSTIIALRSIEVSRHDRDIFLNTGRITSERRTERPIENPPTGNLWVPPLQGAWSYLEGSSCLGNYLTIHRGVEWRETQGESWSVAPQAGSRRGLHTARKTRQFLLPNPVELDCRRERLRAKAIDLPWDRPKLIANAGRLSRGPWRIGTTLDKDGLLCSQQFFGLWPRESLSETQLLTFAAILNGPVANAFLAIHSPTKRIRISAVERIPVPPALPLHVGELVAEYIRHLEAPDMPISNDEWLEALLMRIDAEVLGSYDLPSRLEHQLLDYFRGANRPVAHAWRHWDAWDPTPGLTLAERMSRNFHPRRSSIREVFQPLPADEAGLLRAYGV